MNRSVVSCPLALALSLSLSLANYLHGSLRESKQGTNGTCKRAQTTTHTQLPARRRLMNKNGNKQKIPRTANDCCWRGLREKTAMSNSMGRAGGIELKIELN